MIKNIIQNLLSDVLSSPFGEFLAIVFKMAKSSIVNLTGEIGTFARAATATVEDHEGVIREVLSGEVRFQGQRRVYNMAASTDTPSTQAITVVSGAVYQISIGADSASGATAILTGAATGTLTGDAVNGQSFDTAKTATTTTLTITISGSVKNLQVEDVTGQSNQAPASYVSKGTLSAPYHGTGVDGSKVFLTTNGNSVSSGIVTEATGAAITDAIGYFGEPASTNKCTNYNANPDAGLTGMTSGGGDGSSVWERTLDVTKLSNAGLDAACTSGYVFHIDNTAGAVRATFDISGATNTNEHTMSLMARGDGSIHLSARYGTIKQIFSSTEYEKVTLSDTNNAAIMVVSVEAGDEAYFILNQLEEKAFATSVIITEGASTTRNKDDLSYPTTNIPVSIEDEIHWTPTAAGQGTIYMSGSYVDASNYTAILHDGTDFIARKRIVGVNYDATLTLAYSADTTYIIKPSFSSTNGVGIDVDGSTGTGDANTTDIQLGATIEIGSLNAASHQTGGINNFTITSVD